MAIADEDQTVFHIERGTFCYTKIPFGLRNAGATCERLVDNFFEQKIRRNIEVYVQNMLIKSRSDDVFLASIEETLK